MTVPLTLPAEIAAVAGVPVPSASKPVGYAALIAAHSLRVPPPDEMRAISEKHTMRREGRWHIMTPRYQPADTISAHLEFALRHEGVDLAVLNALFQVMPHGVIEEWVRSEPTGQHARRIWFLYEWLTGGRLDLPDAVKAPYVGILDEKRQFAVRGKTVTRYRIRNNLPGTLDFCPLIRRTKHLETLVDQNLAAEARAVVQRTAPDLMARAAAFLLLENSKASYVIEGERPPQDQIQRWGQAIGEAGKQPLTRDELQHLQRVVIGDARFTHMGWRTEGGFVGKRDRDTNAPIPDHVSARPEDIASLIGDSSTMRTEMKRAVSIRLPLLRLSPLASCLFIRLRTAMVGYTAGSSTTCLPVAASIPQESSFLFQPCSLSISSNTNKCLSTIRGLAYC